MQFSFDSILLLYVHAVRVFGRVNQKSYRLVISSIRASSICPESYEGVLFISGRVSIALGTVLTGVLINSATILRGFGKGNVEVIALNESLMSVELVVKLRGLALSSNARGFITGIGASDPGEISVLRDMLARGIARSVWRRDFLMSARAFERDTVGSSAISREGLSAEPRFIFFMSVGVTAGMGAAEVRRFLSFSSFASLFSSSRSSSRCFLASFVFKAVAPTVAECLRVDDVGGESTKDDLLVSSLRAGLAGGISLRVCVTSSNKFEIESFLRIAPRTLA